MGSPAKNTNKKERCGIRDEKMSGMYMFLGLSFLPYQWVYEKVINSTRD
jgi:hypothetical protein